MDRSAKFMELKHSPAHLEPSHPDLFWYGIHGVEALFTVMGAGCESVVRVSTEDTEFVTGTGTVAVWAFREFEVIKAGGGTAGEKGIAGWTYQAIALSSILLLSSKRANHRSKPKSWKSAFMEAADESKRQGGVPVSIAEVMKKASAKATQRIKELQAK